MSADRNFAIGVRRKGRNAREAGMGLSARVLNPSATSPRDTNRAGSTRSADQLPTRNALVASARVIGAAFQLSTIDHSKVAP